MTENQQDVIKSLRQQVNNQAVDITLLRRKVSALEKQARSQEVESLREQLADMTKERDKAKAMPMRYRRMEFNAQLQNENESMRQQLASLKAELKAIGEAINDPRTDLTMTMSEVIVAQKQQHADALAACKLKE